jgi:hypothetical protein
MEKENEENEVRNGSIFFSTRLKFDFKFRKNEFYKYKSRVSKENGKNDGGMM